MLRQVTGDGTQKGTDAILDVKKVHLFFYWVLLWMGLNFGQSVSEEVFESPAYNLQFHEFFSKFSVF